MSFQAWKASLMTQVTQSGNPSPCRAQKAPRGPLDAIAERHRAEIVNDVADLMRGETAAWAADDRRRWGVSVQAIAQEWGVWLALPAETRGFIERHISAREERR
jgi:hypothetical protein